MIVETTSQAVGAKCGALCSGLLIISGVANESMPIVKWLSFFLAGTASLVSIYLGYRSLHPKNTKAE